MVIWLLGAGAFLINPSSLCQGRIATSGSAFFNFIFNLKYLSTIRPARIVLKSAFVL